MSKTIRMKLGDKMAEVVTINGLAEMLGLSVAAVRKHEERGLLPSSNFRTKAVPSGFSQQGKRLYTVELAKGLSEIFQNEIKRGSATSDVVKQKIKDLFTNERLKYAL